MQIDTEFGGQVPAAEFVNQCKVATLQFVVFKPVLSMMDYAFARTSLKGSMTDYTKPALWITILLNISVSIALASLLAFFHATQHQPRLSFL